MMSAAIAYLSTYNGTLSGTSRACGGQIYEETMQWETDILAAATA